MNQNNLDDDDGDGDGDAGVAQRPVITYYFMLIAFAVAVVAVGITFGVHYSKVSTLQEQIVVLEQKLSKCYNDLSEEETKKHTLYTKFKEEVKTEDELKKEKHTLYTECQSSVNGLNTSLAKCKEDLVEMKVKLEDKNLELSRISVDHLNCFRSLTECKAEKNYHKSSLEDCREQLKEESATVVAVTRDWIGEIKTSRWIVIVFAAVGFGIIVLFLYKSYAGYQGYEVNRKIIEKLQQEAIKDKKHHKYKCTCM